MSETVQSIISDEEIVLVHANANFGSMPKRSVVLEGALKAAFGYHSGHTQMCILAEHGLIRKPRPAKHDMVLTKKGQRYIRAALGGNIASIMAIATAKATGTDHA